MPRQMPSLARRFAAATLAAVGIAEAGELVRAAARRGSIAQRELRLTRLEALHEMAYLRIFVEWELFLEATFLRTQCGYTSPLYVAPAFAPGRSRQPNLAAAQASLYGTRDYLLWHNAATTVARAQDWFIGSPHELVTLSSLSRLESLASIRHGIAHGSDDARRKVHAATQSLAGKTYSGSACGKFLRDWDDSIVPRRRWLRSVAAELQGLAAQISP